MIVRAGLCRAVGMILLVTTSLTACTSWQVQTVAPEQVVTDQHPSAVRVQLLDGSRVVLDSPRIEGDSLLGATAGRETGVPLAAVHNLAVKRGSAAKSIGLVFFVGVVVFAGYYIFALLQWGS